MAEQHRNGTAPTSERAEFTARGDDGLQGALPDSIDELSLAEQIEIIVNGPVTPEGRIVGRLLREFLSNPIRIVRTDGLGSAARADDLLVHEIDYPPTLLEATRAALIAAQAVDLPSEDSVGVDHEHLQSTAAS